MRKIIFLTIIIFTLILLMGCEQQNYKRIVVEENIGRKSETTIEPSVFGQIYLEVNNNDYFYPAFYNKGGVYGYLKKGQANDSIDRKYLYKLDVNNKLTETLKEVMDFKLGHNKVEIIEDQFYMIDYTKRNAKIKIPELSKAINELRENGKANLYEVSYVSGNDKYLIIDEISSDGEITNIFIYSLELQNLYKGNENNKNGDICYVHDLKSLMLIDHKTFKIYKIQLKNNNYTLEEYVDLGINEEVDKIRVAMKNNYELIFFHDVKLGNKDEWNLMGTSAIRIFNFRTNQYNHIFSKPIDENIYIEYLGQGVFIAEKFHIFNDYIELTERNIYFHDYIELVLVYNERFLERSQQVYPEMNVVVNEGGNELFSTREIKKMIDGISVTKGVIYQRINILRPNRNLKPN